MLKYVFKRILLMIPVLIGISFIIFSIISLTPGNPAKAILGERASPEAIDALNEELGYNDPFLVKYGNYLKNAFKGDFGTSYKSGLPVTEEIGRRFPVTLLLAVMIMVITVIVAIPLGVFVAMRKNTVADGTSLVVALLLNSMPSFWLGLLLMLLFSLYLDWLPETGSSSFAHFILPALTLSASNIAQIMRMTRSSMLEVVGQDYIRTAKAKGAKKNQIIVKHALKNALIPVITAVGVNFGYTLGGSVLAESVFGMTGLGSLLLNAIRSKDIPLVMGSVLFMSFLFSIVNLIVDISYGFIDPRIRGQYATGKRRRAKRGQNV
ncbi:MAG: ABC transporter permease [Saccharofermentanales bacterium]|jgi:peptide/nickel transport system permease protein